MKRSFYCFLAFLILGIVLGLSNNDNPLTKTNLASKNNSTSQVEVDNNNNNSLYYIDEFPAPNDTAALKLRGYLVYKNGTYTGGSLPNFWFTGRPTRFPAFNGADSDYVASDIISAGYEGNIDNWLVLPSLDVVALDSICFRSRSPLASVFRDSIRVMFNPLGGTLPSSPGWIELGRFRVNNAGVWELSSFVIPSSALSARLAIRYSVVRSGLNGIYGDYIGIDELRVEGQGVLPVDIASFTSVITNNNVTLNWTTATETNNSGFDIERRDARRETLASRSGQDVWSKVGFVECNGTSTTSQNYSYNDRGLNSGKYNYRLKQIDFNGNFEYFNLSNEVVIGVPRNFELSQNYPNPFNPSTRIDYQLPNDGNVNISVYGNSGKEVMTILNKFKTAGYYSVYLNASSLSSGIYFYKITFDNFSSVRKMMLLK